MDINLIKSFIEKSDFDENIIFTNDPIYDSQIVAQIY